MEERESSKHDVKAHISRFELLDDGREVFGTSDRTCPMDGWNPGNVSSGGEASSAQTRP